MRELFKLSHEVSSLYQEMSDTFSDYQKKTGLTCTSGCGKCCLNPEVEATQLEMLPLAISFYERGIAEEMLEKLQTEKYQHCPLYIKYSLDGELGACSEYERRPTLCRVFGASSRIGKNGKELSVCKRIKEVKQEFYKKAEDLIEEAPLMGEWAKKISVLSYKYTKENFPIRVALVLALELVLNYHYYSSGENTLA